MNKDQIDTVADKAWELANEPDTDFEACVLLKDCAFTIKEQQSLLDAAHKDIASGISEIQKMQSRLESLEQEMQEQARIIGMGAERELALVEKVKLLEKDAARYVFVKTMPKEMLLAWRGMYGCSDEAVDAAMQANKGE